MNDCNNNFDVKQFLSLLGVVSVNNEVEDELIVGSNGEDDSHVYIGVEKSLSKVYCPICNTKMYSKGFVTRKIKHPVLRNGKTVIINLKQRKYRCTNKECNYYLNEEFSFVEKYKQTTVMIPYLILTDMKEITQTCAAVSRQYQLSDTYVHSIIMKYLDFKPLGLSEVISIDEVYLDIEYDKRYVVIVRDFISGDIIDVLPNRNYETLRRFFTTYSKEERNKVLYIVSDMYASYLELPGKYFPNSASIIDGFHIVQILERAIRHYIDTVKKKYQKKLNQEKQENNIRTNHDYKTRKDPPELVLLKRYQWVLLSKPGKEPTISSKHYSKALGIYPTLERIQKMFYELDPMFKPLKELKDEYLNFNDEYIGQVDKAPKALQALIDKYKNSQYEIYIEFAKTLEKYFDQIILSFTLVKRENKKHEIFYQRLSNGPMEGLNRFPKDMKRLARGFSNFDYVRNRLLWSYRENASILAIPKSDDEIPRSKRAKRGTYNKKQK